MAATNQNAKRLSVTTPGAPSATLTVIMLGDVSTWGKRTNERSTDE
jgi:hypothetical protein